MEQNKKYDKYNRFAKNEPEEIKVEEEIIGPDEFICQEEIKVPEEIEEVDVPDPPLDTDADFATVNVALLNVRYTASKDSKILTVLHLGDNVKIDNSFSNPIWIKVQLPNLAFGYLMKSFVDIQ